MRQEKMRWVQSIKQNHLRSNDIKTDLVRKYYIHLDWTILYEIRWNLICTMALDWIEGDDNSVDWYESKEIGLNLIRSDALRSVNMGQDQIGDIGWDTIRWDKMRWDFMRSDKIISDGLKWNQITLEVTIWDQMRLKTMRFDAIRLN